MKNAAALLRHNLGRSVRVAYGTADAQVVGYPLSVRRHNADVQRASDGEIVPVPLWAITAVEPVR